MEYLLAILFIVVASAIIVINIIKVRERNIENDYKQHCQVPPTAMKIKYIKGIPEIDREIERRYSHIIKSAYTKFDESKYKNYLETLEGQSTEDLTNSITKIKNKLNDFRFTKNLDTVDSNMLIYIFEKVGLIDFYFWVEKDNFYLADKHHQGIGCFSFQLNQINCFCKKEQLENNGEMELNISGISTGLEDDTITFNKSSLPQHIKIDGDTTILELFINDKLYCGFFAKEAYEVLVNQISEKELRYLKSKYSKDNLCQGSEAVEESLEIRDEISKKIKSLEEFRDLEVLTQEEYEDKKKLLLEKINK